MLRIHQCRNAAAAQSYYTQGLAREDYYTEGQEVAGVWGGRGAELLGLRSAEVDRDGFVALTENRHPVSGERLTLRNKADRTIGYDMNFHAPKGMSLLHALHRDQRIVEAFRAAVGKTMREIEREAAARVRKGGKQEDRTTGNLVWSEFVHFTARPSKKHNVADPHLHAHCFVFNATMDSEEGVWKAGQFRHIVRDAPYYEAAFHARFIAGVRALGYRVQRTDTGWDVAGVPRSLVDKFSNRTREIEEAAAERNITDPAAKGRLGATTRKAKDKGRTFDDLRSAWDERMTAEERRLMASIAGGEGPAGSGGAPDGSGGPPRSPAERALDWAVEHCFERRSSFPLKRVVAEALRAGLGEASVEDIWKAVPALGLLMRTVRGETLVTTRRVIEEEQRLLTFAVDGKGTCKPFQDRIRERTGEAWAVKDERLDADQRRVLDHVLDSQDRVVAIRGAAGVGKTTMMRETVDAIRAAGHSVVVVAPTAAASRGEGSLREKGFKGADTVAKLLASAEMQRGLTNAGGGGVLWVDEAGLLGVGTMRKLFDLAEKHHARVVLSGDDRQHKPVERGDALRVLEKLGGVASAELTNIRRQKGLYRDAVFALSEGDVDRGLEFLERLDAIREIGDAESRIRAAARDYVDTLAGGKSALVVSPTHAEGERTALAIRELQRERGMLKGEDRAFVQLSDLGWTEAERRDPSRYREGLVAQFHQHAKGVVAGDKCDIVLRDNGKGERVARAVTPRGVEVDLPLDHADRFQVYEKESIKLAVGDRVRITRNGWTADERARLTNGMDHIVTGFTKHGAIMLDGFGNRQPRLVPSKYGHLAYGSVMTSHSAQGKEVDRVIVVQGTSSAGASGTEQFYVTISRGRQSVVIYTDDKCALIEMVKRSGVRVSGIELVTDPAPGEPSAARERDRAQGRTQAERTAAHHAKQRADEAKKHAHRRETAPETKRRRDLDGPPHERELGHGR